MKSLLLLMFLTLNLALASGPEEKIDLQMKIRSTLYQSALQTQLYASKELKSIVTEALVNESVTGSEVDQSIDELLEKISTTNDYKKDKRALSLVKNAVNGVIEEVRGMARKEGIAIAIQLAVMEVVELMSPVILTAIGQPQLIIVAELVLAPEINVPLVLAAKRLFIKRKLIRLYGGKAKYDQIVALKKTLKSEYGLGDDALMFEDEGNNYFSVNSKFNILSKIKSKLSIDKTINPLTLKKVLKRNNLWNSDLQKIKKSDLDSSLISVLMISYAMKNYPDGHEILVGAFPALHFEKNKKVSLNTAVSQWALRFEDVSSMTDLAQLFKEVPNSAKAFEVLLVWKNVFYPILMETSTSEVSYRDYRNWAKNLNPLFVKAELNPTESWSSGWDTSFSSYLSNN